LEDHALTTLKQALDTAHARLVERFGRDSAEQLLEAAADAHYTTDDHKWNEAEAVGVLFDLVRESDEHLDRFEARHTASHYKYADEVYFVLGTDEADAARRFEEAVAELEAEWED
jgi:acyl-homoserine lactone acylase PvdQ